MSDDLLTLKAGSNLEKVLSAGTFAVTGECGPPKSADVHVIEEKAKILRATSTLPTSRTTRPLWCASARSRRPTRCS
jgi:hypothetical protein